MLINRHKKQPKHNAEQLLRWTTTINQKRKKKQHLPDIYVSAS